MVGIALGLLTSISSHSIDDLAALTSTSVNHVPSSHDGTWYRRHVDFTPVGFTGSHSPAQQVLQFADTLTSAVMDLKLAIVVNVLPSSLVTYGPNIASLHCYGMKWGVPVNVEPISYMDAGSNADDEHLYRHSHMYWSRIKSYSKYLQFYDWVLFIDADSMVADHSIPLHYYIHQHPNAHVLLNMRADNGEVHAAGYLVKNSVSGRSFMDAWFAMSKETFPTHLNYDNGALIRLLLKLKTGDGTACHEQTMLKPEVGADEWQVYKAYLACWKDHWQHSSEVSNDTIYIYPPFAGFQRTYEPTWDTPYNVVFPGDFLLHGKGYAELLTDEELRCADNRTIAFKSAPTRWVMNLQSAYNILASQNMMEHPVAQFWKQQP